MMVLVKSEKSRLFVGNWIALFLILFLKLSSALGSSSSEFYIEDGLVEKIFSETSNSTFEKASGVPDLAPMVGILRPETLNVKNKYFSTNYKQLDSLPYFYLIFEGNLFRFKKSQLLWDASIGYGYIQKNVLTYDSSGLLISDTVALQWAPVEFTSRYNIDDVFSSNLDLSVDIGGGRLWVHQDGNIDGFDQTSMTSFVSLGSTLELRVMTSIKILAQVAFFTDLQQKSDYRGLKLGVGTWLSI